MSCDVGGTYARFDSYEVLRSTVQAVGVGQSPHRKGQRPPGKLILKKEYMCQKFKCFEDLLKQFLLEVNAKKAPIAACFAVAGPVINNRVQLMNRDWEIDGAKIAKEFQIKRVLIANDFVALGYGLLTVDDATECICLQDAPKLLNAPIACIGAGTGLGQCFLTPVTNERGVAEEDLDGEDVPALVYNCFPSEGDDEQCLFFSSTDPFSSLTSSSSLYHPHHHPHHNHHQQQHHGKNEPNSNPKRRWTCRICPT